MVFVKFLGEGARNKFGGGSWAPESRGYEAVSHISLAARISTNSPKLNALSDCPRFCRDSPSSPRICRLNTNTRMIRHGNGKKKKLFVLLIHCIQRIDWLIIAQTMENIRMKWVRELKLAIEEPRPARLRLYHEQFKSGVNTLLFVQSDSLWEQCPITSCICVLCVPCITWPPFSGSGGPNVANVAQTPTFSAVLLYMACNPFHSISSADSGWTLHALWFL